MLYNCRSKWSRKNYFCLKLSELRVKERVLQGGHNIPIEAIQRRYQKTISNLFNLYIIFENDHVGINILNDKIYNIMRSN